MSSSFNEIRPNYNNFLISIIILVKTITNNSNVI